MHLRRHQLGRITSERSLQGLLLLDSKLGSAGKVVLLQGVVFLGGLLQHMFWLRQLQEHLWPG